ncbi:MAG: sporulation initiation factor Spo0A C-terminal domain-containing protein [Firmicutes bacterium]|nr:sporulation initiation factor Spo0A C-terminal domain-containing protein [Bacillota bacterium]
MKQQKINWHITKTLIFLGILPSTAGYKYIKEIIYLYIDYDILKLSDAYSIIAKNFSQTPELIAASVRNALKSANNKNLNNKLEILMNTKIFNKNDNVTNGEFFGLMSTYLKYCWDGN